MTHDGVLSRPVNFGSPTRQAFSQLVTPAEVERDHVFLPSMWCRKPVDTYASRNTCSQLYWAQDVCYTKRCTVVKTHLPLWVKSEERREFGCLEAFVVRSSRIPPEINTQPLNRTHGISDSLVCLTVDVCVGVANYKRRQLVFIERVQTKSVN
jgi:hypothetical protein